MVSIFFFAIITGIAMIMATLYFLQEWQTNTTSPSHPIGLDTKTKISEKIDNLADKGIASFLIPIQSAYGGTITPRAVPFKYQPPTNEPTTEHITVSLSGMKPSTSGRMTMHCNQESCNIANLTHSIHGLLTHFANYNDDSIVRIVAYKNYTVFNGTIIDLH